MSQFYPTGIFRRLLKELPSEIEQLDHLQILEYDPQRINYDTQLLILGAASGIGMLALFVLGFRHKQRGAHKEKPKRDAV